MDVSILDLWLPILLSAVAVFFISFVMWMVLPHHREDWGKIKNEDEVMDTLGDIERGQYMMPHCGSPEDMKNPEWVAKRDRGPSGLVVIAPRGPMNMGKSMFHSFLYNLVISIFVAYVASRVFPEGATEMDAPVLQITSTVAFLGYAGALGWNALWFHHKWSTTLKSVFDGVVYGLATGFLFSAMWPGLPAA